METKIIMRYRREKPAWICWNCEMENEISAQECYFCRAKRDNARIIKSWAEQAALSSYDEEKMTDKNQNGNVTENESYEDEMPEKEDSVIGPVIIWTVLLIVIVLIIAVASS